MLCNKEPLIRSREEYPDLRPIEWRPLLYASHQSLARRAHDGDDGECPIANTIYGSSGHSHRTARTVLRIERCTAPSTTLVCAPACFACPNRVIEPVQAGWAGAVDERCVAHEWGVVEAEIP